MRSGLAFNICRPIQSIPGDLAPAPPSNPNFAATCGTYFFGAQTAKQLIVGRITKDGNKRIRLSQVYMLDGDGHVIQNGFSVDGIFVLTLVIYLITAIWRAGATLGDRVLRIVVIDTSAPQKIGLPLRKATLRYLAIPIGYIPLFVFLIYKLQINGGDLNQFMSSDSLGWIYPPTILAAIWVIMIVAQIALKRDPIYDRLVGTAVVRRRPPIAQDEPSALVSSSVQ
jgi:uncharacterized RDD family membrane protein YckC